MFGSTVKNRTYKDVLEELIGKSNLRSWIWRAEDGQMPALPPRAPYRRRASGPTSSLGEAVKSEADQFDPFHTVGADG